MAIKNQKIYLDTCIWIYLLEGYAEYSSQLKELSTYIQDTNTQIYTSDLTLSEILVKPFQLARKDLQDLYKNIFCNSKLVNCISINQEILIKAASIKAEYKFKLPDAIHLSSAFSNLCIYFITNDIQLQKYPDVKVVLIDELYKIGE